MTIGESILVDANATTRKQTPNDGVNRHHGKPDVET